MLLTSGRKLRLFQDSDPYKQWCTLDETRFCARRKHLFLGRDVRVLEDERGKIHFRCLTFCCEGGFADWQCPQFHL